MPAPFITYLSFEMAAKNVNMNANSNLELGAKIITHELTIKTLCKLKSWNYTAVSPSLLM
jgi:hypothetical protein